MAGRSANFPVKLEAGKWYTVQVETVGEQMRVSIDGKPVAYLKSSGIGHPTKRMLTLAVNKSAWVDDVKVWKLKCECDE